MLHALAPPMSHIWYHADRHEQWKGVIQPFCFFCQEPRTAASTENVSRPITDLQRGQILIGIYRREKQNNLLRSIFCRRADVSSYYSNAP